MTYQQHLAIAAHLIERSRDVEAKFHYDAALTLDPKSMEGLKGLAAIANRAGNLKAAQTYNEQLLALDSNLEGVRYTLTQNYIQQGALDRAAEVGEPLFDMSKAEYTLLKAKIFLAKGSNKEAETLLNQLLHDHPGLEEAMILLADLYFKSQRYTRVLDVLKPGIERQPQGISLYQHQLRALLALRRFDEIDALLSRLLQHNKDDSELRFIAADYYVGQGRKDEALALVDALSQQSLSGEEIIRLSLWYRRNGQIRRGLDILDTHIQSNPHAWSAQLVLAEWYAQTRSQRRGAPIEYSPAQEARDRYRALMAKLATIDSSPELKKIHQQAVLSFAGFERKQGDTETARALVDDVLQEQPNNPSAQLLKAELLLIDKKYRGALALLLPLQQQNPMRVEIALLLAQAYNGLVQYHSSLAVLEKILERHRDNHLLTQSYVATLFAAGYKMKAIEYANARVDRYPDNPELLRWYTSMALKHKYLAEARSSLDRLLVIEGPSAFSHGVEGQLLLAQGNAQAAIEALKRSLATSFETERQRETVALMLLSAYQGLGHHQEAINDFAARASDQQSIFYFALAKLYAAQQDLTKAQDFYRRRLQHAPHDTRAYLALATTHFQREEYVEAEAVLREGIRQDKAVSQLHYQLGDVLLKQNNRLGAQEAYLQAATLDSNHIPAINNYISVLTEAFHSTEDLRKQEKWVAKLSTRKEPQILDTAAWYYYHVGDYYQASTLMEKALAWDAAPSVYHYHMGKIYQAQGRKSQAQSSFQQALALSDGSEAWLNELK